MKIIYEDDYIMNYIENNYFDSNSSIEKFNDYIMDVVDDYFNNYDEITEDIFKDMIEEIEATIEELHTDEEINYAED